MSQHDSAYAETRNMNTVHIVFRREFGLMPDLVRSAGDGGSARAKTAADHIRFMNNVLHHHHEAEDTVLWPLLLERAPAEVEPVVRLAEGHHERIAGLLDEVGGRLDAWSGDGSGPDGPDGPDGPGGADSLALALRQLAVAAVEHMNLEERLLMPIVARHVFVPEWEEMEQLSLGGTPPDDIPMLLGMALYEGGEEIVPEPLRADMLPVAPGAYADYATRVYGTPTPPRASEVVIGIPSVTASAAPA